MTRRHASLGFQCACGNEIMLMISDSDYTGIFDFEIQHEGSRRYNKYVALANLTGDPWDFAYIVFKWFWISTISPACGIPAGTEVRTW